MILQKSITSYSFVGDALGLTFLADQPNSLHNVFAALHAGSTSTILTNPLWVVRSNSFDLIFVARIMTQSLRDHGHTPFYYKSTWEALRTIYQTEGWKALYKGLGPSLLGVSHVVIQFPIYEYLKSYPSGIIHIDLLIVSDQSISSGWILFASAFSKMIASSITYPHEVIRTRLHTQTIPTETLTHTRYLSSANLNEPAIRNTIPNTPPKPKYQGLIQSARVILSEEGWKGFYKGFGVNLFRTVPASALTILTFELVNAALDG
jgi:solute carrier family 25 folate transporter 32